MECFRLLHCPNDTLDVELETEKKIGRFFVWRRDTSRLSSRSPRGTIVYQIPRRGSLRVNRGDRKKKKETSLVVGYACY